jgi:hypothetical protein
MGMPALPACETAGPLLLLQKSQTLIVAAETQPEIIRTQLPYFVPMSHCGWMLLEFALSLMPKIFLAFGDRIVNFLQKYKKSDTNAIYCPKNSYLCLPNLLTQII